MIKIKFLDKELNINDFSSSKMGSFSGTLDKNGYSILREERKIRYFLNESIKYKNPVLLDIGSNFGSYSYLTLFNRDLTVYAFEPVPIVYESFLENIKLNDMPNITVFNYALSSSSGEAKIRIPKSNNIGMSKISDRGDLKIELKTLDSHLDIISECHMIKIDVEGHELEVLKGSVDFFKKRNPRYVQVEIWKDSSTKEEIIDWFLKQDYKYKKIRTDYIFFK